MTLVFSTKKEVIRIGTKAVVKKSKVSLFPEYFVASVRRMTGASLAWRFQQLPLADVEPGSPPYHGMSGVGRRSRCDRND